MGYLGNENTVTGTQNSKRIVVQATPNQTISTVTGGYNIGQLDVFRNGVKLARADDYNAENGSTVTFLQALNTGDDIQYVVYENFDVANALFVISGRGRLAFALFKFPSTNLSSVFLKPISDLFEITASAINSPFSSFNIFRRYTVLHEKFADL